MWYDIKKYEKRSIMDDLTARINELAKKQKTEGLSEEEKAEQATLRDEFRRRFRAGFALELENTVIQTPDGKRTRLSDIKNKKSDK